jgi:SAM-dependent methyltransferase
VTAAAAGPVVAGIPYLRAGREELAARAQDRLAAGDEEGALVVLLADQDDWWDEPPPPEAQLRAAARAGTLREAMRLLGYGRVGDYFAYRWSDPTFLSGLALLDAHGGGARSAFELGCGIGHLLRELHLRGARVAGADVVFSKLWLAKRFVVPEADLVCLDASQPLPLADGEVDLALCHDALHYLPDPAHAVGELRRVARTVLLGHVHNAAVPNHSPGHAVSVKGTERLLPGATLHDDAELTAALLEARAPRPAAAHELARSPAVALALGGEPADGAFALPPEGAELRVNPLVDGEGVRWPSARYEEEYAALSPHLTAPFALPAGPLRAGAGPEVDALARRRILLDLPPAW